MPDWITNNPLLSALAFLGIGTAIWKFARWTQAVDSDRNDFRGVMTEIRADIRKIHDRIDSIFGLLSNPVVERSSPLRLTDLGRSIAQTLNAAQIAAEMAPHVLADTAGMPPYDVPEFCRTYVKHEFKPNPELEAQIKNCAYENGLERSQVLEVLAVALRDEILAD